jgi:glycosyltransferase involved in cell wall biosynthesis
MHILLIHQFFLEKDDGGGSRFNEMTAKWVAEGHKVTVISGMVHYASGKKREKYKGKFVVKDDFAENLEVWRCHVSEAYNTNFLGRLWAYFSFVFSSLYAGLFKAKENYGVILVTSPPLFVGITGLLLSKLRRIPLVFEIRDLWPESAIDTGVLTNPLIIKMAFWFEKLIYKHSKLINTLTPAFQQKLIEEKGVAENKVIMIPNAADFSLSEHLLVDFDAKAFRKEHGYDDKLVIVYVGAHGVANHLIQLIDAATLLKDKPVLFLLIGDGMQRESLLKEVETRKLLNVKMLPSVSKTEVFKYILSADIGASVLKKVDTFKTVYSNKTFDYMACQKPILMAIDGVSRDLVELARCGKFVEPESPDDFARKVLYYLENAEKLAEQGLNGYQFAKENFDREILAGKYLDALQKTAKPFNTFKEKPSLVKA